MRKNPRLEVRESKHIVKIVLICIASILAVISAILVLAYPIWPVSISDEQYSTLVNLQMDGQVRQVKLYGTQSNSEDSISSSIPGYYNMLTVEIDGESVDFKVQAEDSAVPNFFTSTWYHADLNSDGNSEIILERDSLLAGTGNRLTWQIYALKGDQLILIATLPRGDLRRSLFTSDITSTYQSSAQGSPTQTVFYHLEAF